MRQPEPPTSRPTFALWHVGLDDLPPVRVRPIRRVVRDGEPWLVEADGDPSDTAVPPDFVLKELLEVDIDDPDDLISFARMWGLPTPHFQPYASSWVIDGHTAIPEDEVQARIGVLQGLAEDWLPDAAANDASDWQRWCEGLSLCLEEFTSFITCDAPGENRGMNDLPNTVSIFGIAGMQLAQIAVRGRKVRRCANSNCGKPFTVQRTTPERRKYAEAAHATGLKYCSHNCAKSQAERERRARIKARKERAS